MSGKQGRTSRLSKRQFWDKHPPLGWATIMPPKGYVDTETTRRLQWRVYRTWMRLGVRVVERPGHEVKYWMIGSGHNDGPIKRMSPSPLGRTVAEAFEAVMEMHA